MKNKQIYLDIPDRSEFDYLFSIRYMFAYKDLYIVEAPHDMSVPITKENFELLPNHDKRLK